MAPDATDCDDADRCDLKEYKKRHNPAHTAPGLCLFVLFSPRRGTIF